MNTAQLVSETNKVSGNKYVARETLKPGDLFRRKNGARTLMHTSTRTSPPSAGSTAGGAVVRKSANGKDIVGYNAIVVDAKTKPIKDGEDGGVVSHDAAAEVELLGRATITLNLFAT